MLVHLKKNIRKIVAFRADHFRLYEKLGVRYFHVHRGF